MNRSNLMLFLLFSIILISGIAKAQTTSTSSTSSTSTSTTSTSTTSTIVPPIGCGTTVETSNAIAVSYPDQPDYNSFQIYMIWIGIFAWTICCILYMTFDAIMISYAMRKARGEIDE